MWVFRYPEVAAAVAAKVSKVRSYLKQCIARFLLDKFFQYLSAAFQANLGWQQLTTADNSWQQPTAANNIWQQLTTVDNSWQQLKSNENLSTKTPFLVWTDSNRGHGQVVSIFCLPFFSSLNKKINIFNKFDGILKKKYSKRDQNVTMSVEKLKRK